ncbi:uncharacterized protein [Miscanthus floridulus]|uniref:uncharacterized protein n=1 Tax=Miscanthus floridulus TaxID=154761 RepID=UPI00345A0774
MEERRLRRSPPVEARRRAREQPWCQEVAGRATAECAAVCCCFPFAVVELVVLAAVGVPAALCRRALRARARCRRASRTAAAKKKEMMGMDSVSKGELQQRHERLKNLQFVPLSAASFQR